MSLYITLGGFKASEANPHPPYQTGFGSRSFRQRYVCMCISTFAIQSANDCFKYVALNSYLYYSFVVSDSSASTHIEGLLPFWKFQNGIM